MNCDWQEIETPDARGWRRVRCSRCGLSTAPTPSPLDNIFSQCKAAPFEPTPSPPPLAEPEIDELMGEADKTLIGSRLKELFAAIGFPPCGGCDQRAEWLNKAHKWLRGVTAQA